jgi:hypothetical protein
MFFKHKYKINTIKIINDLNQYGWVLIDCYDGDIYNLINIVCKSQKISIDFNNYKILIPKSENETDYFSLSSVHGLLNFPLHTDGADYLIPPKYVILRALEDTPTGTIIADSIEIKENKDWNKIENIKWKVKLKNKIFMTNLFNDELVANKKIFRYNSVIMKCLEETNSFQKIISNLPVQTITWKKNKTLILDNWRVLHGREAIKEINHKNRIIERLQTFIKQ